MCDALDGIEMLASRSQIVRDLFSGEEPLSLGFNQGKSEPGTA
jgi:hypothetical protein